MNRKNLRKGSLKNFTYQVQRQLNQYFWNLLTQQISTYTEMVKKCNVKGSITFIQVTCFEMGTTNIIERQYLALMCQFDINKYYLL